MERREEIERRLAELDHEEIPAETAILNALATNVQDKLDERDRLRRELADIDRRDRRRNFRVIEGGVLVLGGLAALARQHPRMAAAAAVSTAAAAGVAATVLTLAPPATVPEGSGPAESPTSVTLTAWTTAVSPLPPSLSPSATVTPSAPAAPSATPAEPVSTATAPSASPTGPVAPSVVVSVSASIPSTLPTLTGLPTPSTLPPTTILPSPSAGTTCLVYVGVASLASLCLS